MRASLITLLAAAAVGVGGVMGQLVVTQPSAAHYWVANSQNTLAWSGTTPTTFSVFLSNPSLTLLTATTALISIEQTYNTAVTIVPNFNPGDGYQILLTDTLNSTNIYAKSEVFSIKPVGSLYPTGATSATGSVVSATGTGSVTGSATAAATTSAKSGAGKGEVAGWGWAVGLGLVGAIMA